MALGCPLGSSAPHWAGAGAGGGACTTVRRCKSVLNCTRQNSASYLVGGSVKMGGPPKAAGINGGGAGATGGT